MESNQIILQNKRRRIVGKHTGWYWIMLFKIVIRIASNNSGSSTFLPVSLQTKAPQAYPNDWVENIIKNLIHNIIVTLNGEKEPSKFYCAKLSGM